MVQVNSSAEVTSQRAGHHHLDGARVSGPGLRWHRQDICHQHSAWSCHRKVGRKALLVWGWRFCSCFGLRPLWCSTSLPVVSLTPGKQDLDCPWASFQDQISLKQPTEEMFPQSRNQWEGTVSLQHRLWFIGRKHRHPSSLSASQAKETVNFASGAAWSGEGYSELMRKRVCQACRGGTQNSQGPTTPVMGHARRCSGDTAPSCHRLTPPVSPLFSQSWHTPAQTYCGKLRDSL